MPTRRAETSQESRRLLIEAAAEAFAEKGYRQTTMVDIADRAGISRGSIPWHFGSKDGLLLAVIEHTFVVATTSFSDHHRPGPDGLADLTEQIAAFVQLPVNRLLAGLMVQALEPDSPIRHQYVELHATMRRIFASWAAQPHVGMRLPDGMTPDDFGTLMLGVTIGIHQQWRLAPERVDAQRAYDNLQRLVLAAMSS